MESREDKSLSQNHVFIFSDFTFFLFVFCWLHKLRNTQGKIHGTYLGNIYGIYKECRTNISIDIYDITISIHKYIHQTHRPNGAAAPLGRRRRRRLCVWWIYWWILMVISWISMDILVIHSLYIPYIFFFFSFFSFFFDTWQCHHPTSVAPPCRHQARSDTSA